MQKGSSLIFQMPLLLKIMFQIIYDDLDLEVFGKDISVDDGGGNIYAVNYNVLRIMSGMGGLAYSN